MEKTFLKKAGAVNENEENRSTPIQRIYLFIYLFDLYAAHLDLVYSETNQTKKTKTCATLKNVILCFNVSFCRCNTPGGRTSSHFSWKRCSDLLRLAVGWEGNMCSLWKGPPLPPWPPQPARGRGGLDPPSMPEPSIRTSFGTLAEAPRPRSLKAARF